MRFSGEHIEDIKRWGFWRFLYAALMWRIEAFLIISFIFVRTLEVAPELPSLQKGREVRLAQLEDLLEAIKNPVMELDRDFVLAAIQRGELCPAVFDGDNMIAYAWRAVQPTPHTEALTVVFQNPYQYSFNAFTHPNYRRQNLQHIISLYTDPIFISQGYTHVVSFVETHNYPSVASNRSRGNIVVGYAGYLKMFSKLFCFRTRGAKRIGFKFVAIC